jgi:nitrate/TMAO reductase-like tetraheme cytochrome c subunit
LVIFNKSELSPQEFAKLKYCQLYLPGAFLIILVLAGCASFSYLTDFEDNSEKIPTPSDCGSCHILQFQEWSLSRHASAFSNPRFLEEFHEAGDDDCLTCHAPMGVLTDNAIPRPFNSEDGVDCISCHYADGTMNGRHGSTALFPPHPVAEKVDFYSGNTACMPCHGETAEEYEDRANDKQYPLCLECHASHVVRSASQGTGLFSNMLVSFEERVETYSHNISFVTLSDLQDVIKLTAKRLETDIHSIEIAIDNGLPHNLPTGTFGEKSIGLRVAFLQGDQLVQETVLHVGDESKPLISAATKSLKVKIPADLSTDATLRITIERISGANSARPPVRIAESIIPLPAI